MKAVDKGMIPTKRINSTNSDNELVIPTNSYSTQTLYY